MRDIIWRFLVATAGRWFKRSFNLEAELCELEGPCFIVANHVTSFDPMLLANSFPKQQISFIASEHMFRWGIISKIISLLVDPIPRSKANSAADTVMKSLRKLKAGGRVAVFGEGEVCWSGVNGEVFPATGKMARMSGVPLVTYRLEGGYLSLPRWAKKVRRGKMRGRVVGIYYPEELRKMKPQEITDIINRDTKVNTWDCQKQEPIEFKARNLAEGIEKAIFICPKCGSFGTVRGEGDYVRCSCGLETRLTYTGIFDPPEPFENLYQWDQWQIERLEQMDFAPDEKIFYDEDLKVSEILDEHKQKLLVRGTISQYRDSFSLAGHEVDMDKIHTMAMVQTHILLLSAGDRYFEVKSERNCCLRKYLIYWQNWQKKLQKDSAGE